MLKTTIIPRIGDNPTTVSGNTVIISDEFGNPLVVAVKIADQTTLVSTFKDGDDFRRILSSLGIDKVVVDDNIVIDAPPRNAELVFDPRQHLPGLSGTKLMTR